MAKLLHREKEFHKLNEDLNKMSIETAKDTNVNSPKVVNNYPTFTKPKVVLKNKTQTETKNQIQAKESDAIEAQTLTRRHVSNELDNEKPFNSQTYTVRQHNPSKYINKQKITMDNNNNKNDNLIRFLKTKIEILEEDHDRLTQEMTQQQELMAKTFERSKLLEQQLEHTSSKNNLLLEQLKKVELELEESNRHKREYLLNHSSQQKEVEATKHELKLLTQTNANLEKRLFRSNEELETAKTDLKNTTATVRELQNAKRFETDNKDKQIKNLKKQRSDLLNAYKKQLYLIDNLKRQNTCLEQSRLIDFNEKEFTKVLDWKIKN